VTDLTASAAWREGRATRSRRRPRRCCFHVVAALTGCASRRLATTCRRVPRSRTPRSLLERTAGSPTRRQTTVARYSGGAQGARARRRSCGCEGVTPRGPRRGRRHPAGQRRASGGWRRTRPRTPPAAGEGRCPIDRTRPPQAQDPPAATPAGLGERRRAALAPASEVARAPDALRLVVLDRGHVALGAAVVPAA
jgi:hypothetical protein